MTFCLICEAAELIPNSKQVVIEKDGLQLKYLRSFSKCPNCGVELVGAEESRLNKKALVRAEAIARDSPLPEKILAWRTCWGITQAAAGKMLRVGPVAFSKYENSQMVPSGPTAAALNVLIDSQIATTIFANRYGINIENASADLLLELVPNQVAISNNVTTNGAFTVMMCAVGITHSNIEVKPESIPMNFIGQQNVAPAATG